MLSNGSPFPVLLDEVESVLEKPHGLHIPPRVILLLNHLPLRLYRPWGKAETSKHLVFTANPSAFKQHD